MKWEFGSFRFKLNTKTQRHEDSEVIIKKLMKTLCLCVFVFSFNPEKRRKTSWKKQSASNRMHGYWRISMVG